MIDDETLLRRGLTPRGYGPKVDPREQVRDAAEEAQHLLTEVTTGAKASAEQIRDYARARATLLEADDFKPFLPDSVKRCRKLQEAWGYVKSRTPALETYQSRRDYFGDDFRRLFDRLDGLDTAPVDPHTTAALGRLDAESAKAAWAAATNLRDSDPAGAVGAACTLLESTLKVILDDHGVEYGTRDDLPKLYKAVARALKLDANDFDDPDMQTALRGAASLVQGIGEIRNRDSKAHGKGRKGYRVTPRHAGVVVAMAGGLATFLVETHEHRQGG